MHGTIESNVSTEPRGRPDPFDFTLESVLKLEEEAFFKDLERNTTTNGTDHEECSYSQRQNLATNAADITKDEDDMEFLYNALSMLGKTFIKTIPKIIDVIAEIYSDSI